MKEPFKLRGGVGNKNPYSSMQKKGYIAPIQQVDPSSNKGVGFDKLRNSVKYEMAKNPEKYNIKPGGYESKQLESFKKDVYYKGRERDAAASVLAKGKQMQEAKTDVLVKDRKVNEGITTDKQRIEGREGDFSDLSIVTNTQYDKAGDKDYTKIGAPRDSYELKGNM